MERQGEVQHEPNRIFMSVVESVNGTDILQLQKQLLGWCGLLT